jgi:putative transposase
VIGSGKFSAKKRRVALKKRYQITKLRAAENFQRWAAANSNPIQFAFPTADMLELANKSLGELLRSVGRVFIQTVMQSEVEELVGKRSQPDAARGAYRWGTEEGFCIIEGQRVPLTRPRVRSRQNNREIPLGSYELFQRASLLEETVWHKIMYGLSMRSYKEVVQQFADAYGLEKSTTSEHFVEASRRKLDQLKKRSLDHVALAAMVIDGTIFKSQNLVVAIGIDRLGHKLVLGLRQGATENAAVVGGLLGDLAERGVDFTRPRLYVIDGSKAIQAAVSNFAGEAAFFQRCQVHKIRNVTEYLPEAKRFAVKFRMRAAYELSEASDARQALFRLHDELMQENPSAAGSLAEGLDHTLTVLELRLAPQLRQSLSSTNGIESSFSLVDRICRQVKRWQGSDHRLRWVASALLFAESHWNRLHGYRHMPALINALDAAFRLRLQPEKCCRVRVASMGG